MISVSSRVLSLSSEAVLLVRAGRIVYANERAKSMIGADCVGRALRELFSAEITEAQARVFTADTLVAGKRLNIRTARLDDMQACFLSEISYAAATMNDAFLYSMRSALMNLRLAQDLCRARAEKLGDATLIEDFRAMQRSFFSVSRLLENASVIRAAAADELTANLETLDLGALCGMIVESVSLLRRDVRFALHAEGELCFLGDRVLIEQMIFNLLSNALLHAEGLTQITLRIIPTPTQLILSVSDDGCGIPEDEMSTVFERYRKGCGISELGRGAGMGLSVVRSIACAHGGTLMLESRQGSGTAARVSLARRMPSSSLASAGETPADMGALLRGLADCLDPSCFDGKMMD